MHIINVVFLLGSESYNRCHHHSAVTCPTLVWATGLQNLVYSYNVTLSLSVTELSGMLTVNSQDRLSQPALMLSYCWQHSFAAISRWSVEGFISAAACVKKAELHHVFWKRNLKQNGCSSSKKSSVLQTTQVQVMVLAGPVPFLLEWPFTNTSKEALGTPRYFNPCFSIACVITVY